MSNGLLFDAIGGVTATWRDREINVPIRYFEARVMMASFLAPVDLVQSLLPSNTYALRWGRNQAVTVLVFNDFIKSDIGGYRETVVGFPVSVGERTLPYLGLRSYLKEGGALFTHDMALDDQDAVDIGVEVAGYPKHLAELHIDLDSPMMRCVWREDGKDVVALAAPRPVPEVVDKRDRSDVITIKDGYTLRSELNGYVGRAARIDRDSISVEFGDHPRTTTLRPLLGGDSLGGRLVFDRQLALSQPLEGWK